MKIQKHVLLIWLVWSVVQIAGAESLHKLTSYKRYIHEYKSLAIEQQHKYKIPASITLAQGLLESGCLLYTSPSPRDKRQSRMPSSA